MKNHTLSLSYQLLQSSDTEQLAAKLALLCPKALVIFLKGPLGAGKTTFARGFIQALGEFARIKSPTYTLVESYDASDKRIFHFDLYRLQDPEELEAMGIRDYTLTPAIWLIEWPERALLSHQTFILPSADIVMSFSLVSNGHEIIMHSCNQIGEALLKNLRQ